MWFWCAPAVKPPSIVTTTCVAPAALLSLSTAVPVTPEPPIAFSVTLMGPVTVPLACGVPLVVADAAGVVLVDCVGCVLVDCVACVVLCGVVPLLFVLLLQATTPSANTTVMSPLNTSIPVLFMGLPSLAYGATNRAYA